MTPSAGPAVPRVVLDTNVFVSAALFGGTSSRLVPLWQSRRFLFLISRPILEEYLRVLSYPKFDLSDREVKEVVEEELLPFVEVIRQPAMRGIPFLKDPQDRKFLACARAGRADYLLTGDKELLAQTRLGKTLIVSPADYLEMAAVIF